MPGIDEIVENNEPIVEEENQGLTSGETIAVITEEGNNNEPAELTGEEDDVTEEQAETIVAATSSIYIVTAKLLKELHIINTDEFTQMISECAKEEDAA